MHVKFDRGRGHSRAAAARDSRRRTRSPDCSLTRPRLLADLTRRGGQFEQEVPMATRPGPLGFRVSALQSAGVDWPTLGGVLDPRRRDAALRRGLAQRPPHRREPRPGGAGVRGDHGTGGAGRPRARDVGRSGRRLQYVPASGRAREIGRGPGQRDRRQIHPGPRGRLARRRARPVRHPSAAHLRAVRPIPERDRSADLPLLRAARRPPGVTLPDRFYPLRGATIEPQAIRRGGPPLWLGVGKRRGIELAARFGEGWPMPGNRPGRRRLLLQEARRDPAGG